ncbi:twin-arginine translocase TatA/TatE family subunit [Kitasatospora sp. NBC_01250]|uniref:twin-arginine translocase TatA/TatE family subunit n=1 Tax=unclassified Kitasatospora TaxID=2633591 RepID=UPI002E0D4DC5|nr:MULTISPECIES: twin-arginine translocase TatA/TatE family subunit [unclassified Kitasatospora]WSJ70348.1 twin-arginine translocase TatA/TatE family subunit [Kitasatospora sp. NBC_01302]
MGRILAFLVIILMAAVFFGGKRLPDLARALGRSLRILKSETAALREEFDKEAKPPVAPPQADPALTIKAAPGDSSTARPATEQRTGRTR